MTQTDPTIALAETQQAFERFNEVLELTRRRVEDLSGTLEGAGAMQASTGSSGDGAAMEGPARRMQAVGDVLQQSLRRGGDDFEASLLRSLSVALQIARALSSMSSGGRGGGSGLFGFLGGMLSLFSSFEGGGYTGNIPGSRPAGIVHGGEVVFEKPIVDVHRDGLLALRSMLAGGARLSSVLPAGMPGGNASIGPLLAELRNLRAAWSEVRIEPSITIGQTFDTQRFFIEGDEQLQSFKRKKLV